jgi:hypothetical protein
MALVPQTSAKRVGNVLRLTFENWIKSSTSRPIVTEGVKHIYWGATVVDGAAPAAAWQTNILAADWDTELGNPINQGTPITYFPLSVFTSNLVTQVGYMSNPPLKIGFISQTDTNAPGITLFVELHY